VSISAHCASVVLRESHEIRDQIVTLGDLFQLNQDSKREQIVDQGLLPGKTKRYPSKTLSVIAIQYKIPWHPVTNKEQILITRQAASLDHQKLASILMPKAIEVSGNPLISFKFDKQNYAIHLPLQKELTFTVKEFNYDPVQKKFASKIMVENLTNTDQTLKGPYYISGQISDTIEIPILVSPMRSGEVITERNIDFIEINSKKLNSQMIFKSEDLIGKTPRRLIRSYTPIKNREVLEPIIVKKNTLVKMIYHNNNIHVSTKGKALENGAKGDIINVMNTSSKRTIQAEVINMNEVRVPQLSDDGS